MDIVDQYQLVANGQAFYSQSFAIEESYRPRHNIIDYVSDVELMPYLIKHFIYFLKCWIDALCICSHGVNSDGEEINDIMERILKKYHIYRPMGQDKIGSNTEENYSQQSKPATNSSGGGFWGWVGDHSKGISKIAGVAAFYHW